jgi:hypothetical protein
MSRELQDKAERMIRELKDSLIPIKEEIEILRSSSLMKKNRDAKVNVRD